MTMMSLVPDAGMLAMPDSVRVADLPGGYDAYLGYADGEFANGAALARRFPVAHRVLLTVTGATLAADGYDCEPGNGNAADTRIWVQRKLQLMPLVRPVVYADLRTPNYSMGDVLAALARNGIRRSRVRLLSAHYGHGPHICGPDTCKETGISMDGTQWTDNYLTTVGKRVDMSMLRADFFSRGETETERVVRELGVVRQGDEGETVKTVQGLCCARGWLTAIDGVYGPDTKRAVGIIQQHLGNGIAADGVVGPLTWPVLLGVA